MDSEQMERVVNDIDLIDPVDSRDNIIIYEEAKESGESETSIPCDSLKTGNIVKQVFNLVASFREKDYWELNDKEVKSLNNTCPKILPAFIIEHSGIIGCVLNILAIILKRLKLEKQDSEQVKEQVSEQVSEDEPQGGLVGGRTE